MKKSKIYFIAFLFAILIFANISIIFDTDGISISLIKSLFAQPVPCVECSPDWPDCNSGGGPGGGVKKGWITISSQYWQCYKVLQAYKLGILVPCWQGDGGETEIIYKCVSSNPEIPDPNCIVGQVKSNLICQNSPDGTQRGRGTPYAMVPCQ